MKYCCRKGYYESGNMWRSNTNTIEDAKERTLRDRPNTDVSNVYFEWDGRYKRLYDIKCTIHNITYSSLLGSKVGMCPTCYREENIEKISQNKKEYHENNKVEISAYRKEYYENNKNEILARNKEYQTNNKDIINQVRKIYREENIDKINKQKKIYREKYKEQINIKQNEKRNAKDNPIIQCECGIKLKLLGSKSKKHLNSKAHVKYIENKMEVT